MHIHTHLFSGYTNSMPHYFPGGSKLSISEIKVSATAVVLAKALKVPKRASVVVSVLLPGEKRPAKSGNIELKDTGSALAPGASSKKVYMYTYIYTYAHTYIHRRFKDHRGHEHIHAYIYTGLTSN